MKLYRLHVRDYQVACITVIPDEYAAFKLMFDLTHERPIGIDRRDPNHYEFGEVAGHNVVLCPAARSGTNNAAITATDLRRTFPGLRFGLLVGIGGGVPNASCDIRLGDVVVAAPGRISNSITHHDHGKQLSDAFILLNFSASTPWVLEGALRKVQAYNILGKSTMPQIISAVTEKHPVFQRPGDQHDLLFQSAYEHVAGNPNCDKCAKERLKEPSGNQVVKSSEKREFLRESYGVYCIEMEAAGVMPTLPSLVIRGISDYADSHKNDRWQKYAALAAAAYAKELLTRILPSDTSSSLDVSSTGMAGQTTSTVARGPQLENLLEHRARQTGARDWRSSIVDLLKVLGMKSDRTSRDDLAVILQVSEGSSGSARRNNALRRALMGCLAVEDGDVVFSSILDTLRY
ncbi:nucleoside phosphorylase domain-containing protein [Aspergillus similis]